MTSSSLAPEVQALLHLSSQHLLADSTLCNVQQLRQRWLNAQSQGDYLAQQAIRQQVTATGRQLQKQHSNPEAKAQWLALMGLRCSMLMPRLRF